MKRETDGQHIALFVDFENLVTRTGLSAEQFDIAPALDTLLDKGKVLFRRAYCDWTRFAAATRNLHEHGVELIDVPPSTRAGKNGADVRLVIDALELAYLREHIDTFVIASGDSDFCPSPTSCARIGRSVIGMGVREATSPLFVKACDEFLYLRPARRSRETGTRDKEGATAGARPGEHPSRQGDRPGDRARGALGAPRPGERSGEPLRNQRVHRPQGTRLRRARPRLLHLQEAHRGAREGGTAEARTGRQGAVVRARPLSCDPGPEQP